MRRQFGDKTAKVCDHLFTAYKNIQRAIHDDHWKFIRYPQINKTQFFDLQNDPHELKNLAEKLDHVDKVKAMLALLATAQNEYGDACPPTSAKPADSNWSPERTKTLAPQRRSESAFEPPNTTPVQFHKSVLSLRFLLEPRRGNP